MAAVGRQGASAMTASEYSGVFVRLPAGSERRPTAGNECAVFSLEFLGTGHGQLHLTGRAGDWELACCSVRSSVQRMLADMLHSGPLYRTR